VGWAEHLMASPFTIVLDEAAIRELTESPRGPVATRMLDEAARIITRSARIHAPVADYMPPGRPPPGSLFNSIGYEIGEDTQGLYAEIYANFYDRFLEKPAKQIRRPRRTLRNAVRQMPRIL
jgi:hypothetical protein